MARFGESVLDAPWLGLLPVAGLFAARLQRRRNGGRRQGGKSARGGRALQTSLFARAGFRCRQTDSSRRVNELSLQNGAKKGKKRQRSDKFPKHSSMVKKASIR